MTIELNHVQKPTGQRIGHFTIDAQTAEIVWDVAVDGPNYAVVEVLHVPISATETKLEMHHKRGRAPLWWGKKHQDACMLELNANRLQLIRRFQNRPKVVSPTGYIPHGGK